MLKGEEAERQAMFRIYSNVECLLGLRRAAGEARSEGGMKK